LVLAMWKEVLFSILRTYKRSKATYGKRSS